MSSSNIYKSPLCSCVICRETKSAKGIHSHYLAAHTKEGNDKVKSASKIGSNLAAQTNQNKFKEIRSRQEFNYSLNPALCARCGILLDYKQKNNKFCSHACAAVVSNALRGSRSNETKHKISQTLSNKRNKKAKIIKAKRIRKIKPEIVGEFIKIYHCSCKACMRKFIATSSFQYCEECKGLHSNLRMRYRFSFNVYLYPELFNIPLLIEKGFYSPRGKSGKWNPNGLSRDHKVSVHDAITNKYNPYYITHPCNCELMPHTQNNKKKTKSSISYSELVRLVDLYDMVQRVGNAPTQSYWHCG